MLWRVKRRANTIIEELAEAIATLDPDRLEILLSDTGAYAVQNEQFEVSMAGKTEFINWLKSCHNRFLPVRRFGRKVRFTVVKSMHSRTGSHIILFNEGRFPSLTGNQDKNEKSGLVISAAKDKIEGVELCFLVMKTESPFIYERRFLKPL